MSTKRGQKPGLGTAASNGKPANAWARPLQSKGATSAPPGMGAADKANAANGQTISSVNRERLLHLSLTLIGQKVVVAQKDGSVLEGILHTFTPFSGLPPDMKNKYVLKAVKATKKPQSGENVVKDGSTVIIPVEKVIYLHAKNVNLERQRAGGAGASFGAKSNNDVMTDTQISRGRAQNLNLVAAGTEWTTGAGNSRAEALAGGGSEDKGGISRKDFGSAATARLQGNIGQWDQFKANQELFNVNATFDENLYTTELDKSQIDARKIAEAERIAKEIENTSSTNLHVAEERGHVLETDFDEEDRYSGVLTKDGKQRHAASSSDDAAGQESETSAPVAPKKVMNYAAAAAKADGGKKAGPPGFAGASQSAQTTVASPEPKETEKPAKVTPDEKESKKVNPEEKKDKQKKEDAESNSKEQNKNKEKKTDNSQGDPSQDDKEKSSGNEDKEKKEKKDAGKKTSKLNANAKAFTFNPSAKSFTPSFGQSNNFSNQDSQQQAQPVADPNVAMQMHPNVQSSHYMHGAPMGQPGMMPAMMNPQFQGMRYPPQYGMDQHVSHSQMQSHQPQHVQASGAPAPSPPPAQSNSQAASSSEEEPAAKAQEGDGSQQQPQQQQAPPQQQMQVQYGVPPPNAYFSGGGMAMHPRGPGGGYPPQFAPQQMRVGPGGTPYGHMYPMQPGGMPPNMHMRGPGGAPYYPGPAPMQNYPPTGYHGHGMMDDSDQQFRGGRGRGSGGRGRGRRGGRGRGPGGRGYQQNYGGQNAGRSTPQQNAGPDASEEAAASGSDGKSADSGAAN